MSLTFGLTGSICCGKSTVGRYFKSAGIPIVDADIIAREVVVPGSIGLNQIVVEFGEKYVGQDGTLDRKLLGKLVSSSKKDLARLNEIMYPLIKAESEKQIVTYHSQGCDIVCYDGALLIENNNADKFRPLVVVYLPLDLQVKRLMDRNNLSEEAAKQWINLQFSSEEKIKYADYVIETTRSLKELELRSLEVLSLIRNKYYEQSSKGMLC